MSKLKWVSLVLAVAMMGAGKAIFAAEVITITATVATINEISLHTPQSTSFGTVNLDGNRVFIDGQTLTPNAVTNNIDPWQTVAPLKFTLTFRNNLPGNLYIYTNHQEQPYFADVDTDKLTPTLNITGLIHVGNSTPGDSVKNSALDAKDAYLSAVPMRAWVDMDSAGSVTTNASANWIWVSDISRSYNDIPGKPGRTAQIKQRLLDYALLNRNNLDFYIRAAFAWPKYAGNYAANVIIEFSGQ